MIRAAFLLAIVVMLIAAARSFLPEETSLVGSGATLAFGFVLLAALQSGALFAGMRMPRLTGYLPLRASSPSPSSSLNFVTERMVGDLKLVNNVAIGLIALSAGGELNFRRIRARRLRAILSVGGVCIVIGIAIGVIRIAVLRAVALPPGFMADMDLACTAPSSRSRWAPSSLRSRPPSPSRSSTRPAPRAPSARRSSASSSSPTSPSSSPSPPSTLSPNSPPSGAVRGRGHERVASARALVIHIFGSLAAGAVLARRDHRALYP